MLSKDAFSTIWTEGLNYWRAFLIVLCYFQQVAFSNAMNTGMVTAFFFIFVLCVSGHAAFLKHRLLLWLGAISYPLYLVRAVTGIRVQIALHSLGLSAWPNLVVSTSLALALAWGISALVERPAGRAIRGAAARWMAERAVA